jgi:diguanylate cyclase (GGDEF)-like protein/PAS domain S-box-containing protein
MRLKKSPPGNPASTKPKKAKAEAASLQSGRPTDGTGRKQARTLQEAVYRIAAAAETTKSLEELYPQIHQIISSVMPAENFYITLYDETQNLLRFSYFKDAADAPFMGGIQPGKGLTAYVLRTGKSLLCTQAVHDEMERRGEVKLLGVPSAIWLGVPLIVEGKTIGAMVVQHYSNPKAYGEREQHMLEFVSTQVAIAINRKRVEEKLEEERILLRTLINNLPDRIYVMDAQGRKILSNIADWQASGGKRMEDVIGKTDLDIYPPELAKDYWALNKTVIDSGNSIINREQPGRDSQGKPIWILSSKVPLRDGQGKVVGLVGIAHDITERKQTQILQEAVYRIAAATETTRSLEGLYPQIHQIISSVMPAENFYISLYDESKNLLRFSYIQDALDEPYVEGIQPGKGLTAYVLRTGKSLLCTQAVHDELERQGEVKLLGVPSAIWLGVPLIVEGKTIGAMVVQHYSDPNAYGEREQHMLEFVSTQVAIAINRKRAEDALRQSEAELRALFISMHDVVLVIDRFGTYLKIAPTNPESLVRPAEELLGRTLGDVFPFELAGTFLRVIQQVLETKQTKQIEYNLVIGNQTTWFETSVSPMTEDSTLWVAHNITGRKQAEEALKESQQSYQALVEQIPGAIYRDALDENATSLYFSPQIKDITGYSPEEWLADPNFWLKSMIAEDRTRVIGENKRHLETGEKFKSDYRILARDGRIIWVRDEAITIHDSSGQPLYDLGIITDITERKRFELVQDAIHRITQATITSEGINELYQSIHSALEELIPAENLHIALIDPLNGLINFPYYVDHSDETPIWMTQVQGLTEYIIRTGRPFWASREIFDQLVGQGEVQPVGALDGDWMGAPLKVEGRMIGVMVIQSDTQGLHFKQEDLSLLELVSAQVAQAIERKRLEEEIKNLSLTDELTGLYNRRGFTLLVEQEMKLAQRNKRSALLFFVDVDDLKVINDTWGHAQGDAALKETGAILRETFREADILARLGGDEFVILAPDLSLENGAMLTSRIQFTLKERNQQNHRPYHLTLSMGIAHYDPESPCTVDELINQADNMMYEQKQGKKI